MTSGEGTTTLAERPVATQRPDWDEWYERRWRVASLVLVLLLVAMGGAAFVAGEKRSSYGDLAGAVLDGSVNHVEVFGLPDDSPVRGTRTYYVRWRETVTHYTEVTVVQGDPAIRGITPREPGRVVTNRDPVDLLGDLDPDLPVIEEPESRHASFTMAGWTGPFALWWMALAAVIGVFVLVVSGPRPWRATRWAWFWLFALASPIGLVAYVVLAGPLAYLRPADTSRRRLTGGWAFLIAWLVLGSFVGGSRL